MKKEGGVNCKRLCAFEKHEVVRPKVSKFCLVTCQQAPKEGESGDGSIQIFVSHSYTWLLYVGIWNDVLIVCQLEVF